MTDNGTTRKIHSLIDKIYHPTNLLTAWEKVKENKGSGESTILVLMILKW
ncbi:hypothetical protein [Lederbergia lenta]|uniref:Uncharacterized protein n=1 Tax=Lederbergia lenta TaxID=1467 RepID=A0A2X4WW10_LEDLE|nr:hypothetical protein [Lederbergia lenta]MEC2323081.1 hypothetical protein [Lederbergia lenta]SQI62672.1 Uncharacterised protein [Lederbergia lenta]